MAGSRGQRFTRLSMTRGEWRNKLRTCGRKGLAMTAELGPQLSRRDSRWRGRMDSERVAVSGLEVLMVASEWQLQMCQSGLRGQQVMDC